MLPKDRGFRYVPGRVPRARDIAGINANADRIRAGLRGPSGDRPIYAAGALLSGGATMNAVGDSITLPTAGVSAAHLILPMLYVGDRILSAAVSASRTSTQPLICQVVRYPMMNPTALEVLFTWPHLAPLTTTRALIATVMAPITTERGYVYRVKVIAGNAGDIVHGGNITTDHPL